MPKSIPGVMREFKSGVLHSGSSRGRVVTNPKQAIAIALSEQRPTHAAGTDTRHSRHLQSLMAGMRRTPR